MALFKINDLDKRIRDKEKNYSCYFNKVVLSEDKKNNRKYNK